ncbi:MAG: hypothetical protein ACRBN8_19720 [Nannocystales bacterium]
MLSSTANQSMRVENKDGDLFADFANAPSVLRVLVNDEDTAIVATIHRIVDAGNVAIAGLYVFRFDGSTLSFDDRVTIQYRHTDALGNIQDREVEDTVCARADIGRVVGV